MMFSNRRHPGTRITPWMLIGAVAILMVVVVVLAIQNIDREKRYMSRILQEKGAALIKTAEAGARTGMMGTGWGGKQVQILLEEAARQPDIVYLAVTDGAGKIVAANDASRVGLMLHATAPPPIPAIGEKEAWRLTEDSSGRNIFEVYRYFRPLALGQHMGGGICMPGKMGSGVEDWCCTAAAAGVDHFIFAGLDTAALERARAEDIGHTLIISSILVLLGFGGFLSLFWAQNYRTAKSQLRDSNAFAEEVVTYLPVGLIATDREGRIAFFNDAAGRITGTIPDDALGKDPGVIFPDQWCPVKTLLTGEHAIHDEEMSCAFSSREDVPVSVSATKILTEEGDAVGNILILRDLGEVRKLQKEIRRKEKLAALGGLAAGVAHEIRNPLSSIKGLASYFGSKSAKGSEDKEAAAVMVREVDRLNRVITELLEFSRPSHLKCTPSDIGELLTHSLRLIRMDADGKDIEIELAVEGESVALLDPDRFSQCLLNLYLNAIQAMETGGILSVKSRPVDGRHIRVEVSDTGKGIPPGDLPKIFDPYFTSKAKGTGLGLAVVHKIIEAHGGRIEAKSTPGEGTVFSMLFPRQTNTEL